MRRRDLAPTRAHAPHGRADRAVRRAPAEDERVGPVGVVDLELGDVGGDAGDLRRAQPHHQVVVLGVVRDVAGLVLLLEPADPVLEARRPGDRPTAGRASPGRAGREGSPPASFGSVANSVEISSSASTSGMTPRLGAVREVRVREQEDRRPVLDRDARRLDRRVEAVGRGRGRDDRDGGLGVPSEEHHEQVGLLRLRRHPRRRPRALDVDDDERELERHRQADRLRLQHDPGAGRGGHAERAAERCPERGPRSGDLVLGLERADSELLEVREVLEDRPTRE